MEIQENVFLNKYTTLRLGGQAKYFSVCKNDEDIVNVVNVAKEKNLPVFPFGGGSNLIINDNVPDAIFIKLENTGFEVLNEDDKLVKIKVYAGHLWDEFVDYAVEHNLSGIEALSAIPGTVGATPVQNVGAYGTEVSKVIHSVRGYNFENNKFEIIENKDCRFSYRNSIFKNELKNKFIIESVIFNLKKGVEEIPDYPKVREVLLQIKSSFPNLSHLSLIRKTIEKIRSEKLPNPEILPNVGSFFKNIITDRDSFKKLIKDYPEMPYFVAEDKYKIPSGWLIEKVGYKGVEKNGVGTFDKNALILVNRGAKNTNDLLLFAKEIQDIVKEKFNLRLEIEPEII